MASAACGRPRPVSSPFSAAHRLIELTSLIPFDSSSFTPARHPPRCRPRPFTTATAVCSPPPTEAVQQCIGSNHQPDVPSAHRCHPRSFNYTVPSRSMPQLESPKWQICSSAYGIIELHLFVLSLFPCSSSATTVLCLLFDRDFGRVETWKSTFKRYWP